MPVWSRFCLKVRLLSDRSEPVLQSFVSRGGFLTRRGAMFRKGLKLLRGPLCSKFCNTFNFLG